MGLYRKIINVIICVNLGDVNNYFEIFGINVFYIIVLGISYIFKVFFKGDFDNFLIFFVWGFELGEWEN